MLQVDPNFFLRYMDVRVGRPSYEEDLAVREGEDGLIVSVYGVTDALLFISVTPHECRLRDLTYSAPINVDVKYTRGRTIVLKKNVTIGRLPIMLRSSKCVLTGKSPKELAKLKECIYDPGGYFVVRVSRRQRES